MDTTTTPERFIVVDGNVYWLDTPAPIAQPDGARPIRWAAPVTLMHAPVTATGQIAWQDSGIVEACEPAQVDAIVAALTETYSGIQAAHEVA
jgi:hypothetical protein